MTRTTVPDDLKPYLRYSAALHAAIGVGLVVAFLRGDHHTNEVYTIDIVGPSAPAAQAPSAAEPSPSLAPSAPAKTPVGHMEEQKKAEEFSLKRRHEREALPAPSLLEGYQNVSAPKATSSAKPAAPAAPAQNSNAPGAPGSVSMELSDFPYPWYLSQIRMALWSQWSAHMPAGQGHCVVVFSILSDGSVTDLRTEESSGDAGFDLTALSAVKDAAPFPPLPQGFDKPFLTIHLTLTSS